MRLSEFIRKNHSAIVREWETFAATLLPAASGMTALALRDHAEEILNAIVVDLESPQNAQEQSEKSKGLGEEHRMEDVGRIHDALRIEGAAPVDVAVFLQPREGWNAPGVRVG